MISIIRSFFFVVVPDPIVTDNPVSADVGSPAVLTCNVSNNPSGINYKWKRDGKILVSSETYHISSVNVSHAGVYTCEAKVSPSVSNPYVNPESGSVNVTLTVTSK